MWPRARFVPLARWKTLEVFKTMGDVTLRDMDSGHRGLGWGWT